MSEAQLFRSKIDTWLVLLLAVVFALPLIEAGRGMGSGRAPEWALLLLLIVPFGLIGWIFTTTCYVVGPDQLTVRSGPFRWRVPLQSVTKLRATHNPLSSPALSLDRIAIEYGSRRMMISPADKDGFVRAILRQVPHVKLEGLRV